MNVLAEPIQTRLHAVSGACLRHGVLRLSLFGSAAADDFDPRRSDFDFLVKFRNPPPNGLFVDFFELKEELRDILGADVDLLLDKHFEDPDFRATVEETRTLVFTAPT